MDEDERDHRRKARHHIRMLGVDPDAVAKLFPALAAGKAPATTEQAPSLQPDQPKAATCAEAVEVWLRLPPAEAKRFLRDHVSLKLLREILHELENEQPLPVAQSGWKPSVGAIHAPSNWRSASCAERVIGCVMRWAASSGQSVICTAKSTR